MMTDRWVINGFKTKSGRSYWQVYDPERNRYLFKAWSRSKCEDFIREHSAISGMCSNASWGLPALARKG